MKKLTDLLTDPQEGAVNLGLGTSGRIKAKKSEVSGNRDVTSMLSREV